MDLTQVRKYWEPKALGDDISLIGGGRYDYNGRQGRGTFIPEVGIQYKKFLSS